MNTKTYTIATNDNYASLDWRYNCNHYTFKDGFLSDILTQWKFSIVSETSEFNFSWDLSLRSYQTFNWLQWMLQANAPSILNSSIITSMNDHIKIKAVCSTESERALTFGKHFIFYYWFLKIKHIFSRILTMICIFL